MPSFSRNIKPLLPEAPLVSVIIPSYYSKNTIEDCLLSLERQETEEAFEVIVVNSSSDGTDSLIQEKFPGVRLYSFPQMKSVGEARNIGITVSRGEIIAVLDADCLADKNWIEEILKAHQSLDIAIGGAIGNGNPESFIGWAAYFTEFSKWLPDTPPQQMIDIAGCNMSYKRKVFQTYGLFIEGSHCSDTEMHWRLLRQGHRLRFVPSILVYHCNTEDVKKFLKHEFSHGQSFGLLRAKAQNFSSFRRLVYVIFCFFIFLKLFLKVGWANIKNRVYLCPFLKSISLLPLGLLAWSLGECSSYIRMEK
jgi:GT2 family glycosyltransferase